MLPDSDVRMVTTSPRRSDDCLEGHNSDESAGGRIACESAGGEIGREVTNDVVVGGANLSVAEGFDHDGNENVSGQAAV